MSTEVKPTDWDAEDNMWEPTPSGGGGGSSLPSYSSADIGKSLTIGEDGGSVEPKWENVGGVQILIPVTADNAPAPPSGYTPQDYKIYSYDGAETSALEGVTPANGAPAFTPSFVHSEPEDGISIYEPVQIGTIVEPTQPITPVTGEGYVLTLKTAVPSLFTMNPTRIVVDLSNLEWVEYNK